MTFIPIPSHFHSRPWEILDYRVAQIKIPHRTKCNFSTTVWDFCTQAWFMWERSCYNSELKKKYFSFLQSYGCINILCHIFNSVRNNQQQLVIFIVKKHWLLLQIPKSHKYFILAYVRSVHHQLSHARSLVGKFNMALLIDSCGSWYQISCRTFLSSSMFSSLGWNDYSV